MTTTVSSTPCWKSAVPERLLRILRLAFWLLAMPLAQAQTGVDLQQLRADRAGGEVLVSASVVFELPGVVEDALLKGIPLFFMLEADLLQERWYWYDKKVTGVQRQLRLVYQPLTRRWRINSTTAPGSDNSQGLSLSQGFDTLSEAMDTIKQVSRWKVSDLGESEASGKYRVEFRFRLDLGQLPRPFQIGAIGQSEWNIQASGRSPLRYEASK